MSFYKQLQQTLSDNKLRAKITLAIILLMFALLEVRLFTISHKGMVKNISHNISKKIQKGKYYFYQNKVKDSFSRLDIEDRNGNSLARNVSIYDFYLTPYKMIDIKGNIQKLKSIIPITNSRENIILNKLYTKRRIEHANVLIKKNITLQEKEKLIENGVLGLYFEESEKRVYPYANNALHVVGFVAVDGKGLAGVEKEMDNYLQTLENKDPLRLSIDINVQNTLREQLLQKMIQTQSKSASGIVMNIKTGEVFAAVSLPDCNPNNITECSAGQLFNHFALGSYELGSVFKLLLAALTFEEGFSPYKKYKREAYKIGKYTIHDIDKKDLKGGEMTIIDIVKHSSNVGCAKIIEEIGPSKQKSFFEKIGILDKIDLEIPETGRSIFPSKWRLVNAVTISYGHGIALPPINFASVMSSILNEYKIKPTIFKNEDNYVFKGERIISHKAAELLKDFMREVVTSGAGHYAAVEKYDIGGKSGTAIKQINGLYNKHKMLLSFVAAAPISDPEYLFFITLDEPYVTADNNHLIRAGSILGPLMANIIASTGPILKITTNATKSP
jgi:cell division protein FtsI (penicillin-binding protein 3)